MKTMKTKIVLVGLCTVLEDILKSIHIMFWRLLMLFDVNLDFTKLIIDN